MKLDLMTWQEVDAHLARAPAIILPTGSIEQHGPMGLIGTDAICAEDIAQAAAELTNTIVAPTLCYGPAPFNMDFPGTMSLSFATYQAVVRELFEGLISQGFKRIYVLNGHGANLEPLRIEAARLDEKKVRARSWWDFEPVNNLRREWYGDWEGMHATPSEISITQVNHRAVLPGQAQNPPVKLSSEFIQTHAGDKHGPAAEHRVAFPDGRVGSHSALASREQGEILLKTAAACVAKDFASFTVDI
ncbi:creatininase family protein [Pseudohalocynthiibacter aestuariivivens]|jgi:creatinine amidohydrolase|uniref:Creatininase family protein n=1 Tax=Pseudohalocynthiibacter aestuariivivens TaxID=1591409 RepID=A0ABV5JB01_9RHOB|nr:MULTISPECIES: creatininase family protein [Pseudohalocynthiibacter]MBS9715802.1 creatininase family protein [Pseudohalocynthiibacter aestuariivivens]MCK0101415.1 creatininase family protein [Pseudohalocynthiibacter sp. F2068]